MLHEKWKILLDQELAKEYMIKLRDFITDRRKVCNVLPDGKQLFSAFSLTDWDNLKIVIIGQDPYPTRQDAHGLAFSSPARETPYSLKNIFEEITNDIFLGNPSKLNLFPTNNLISWCRQGVLLLNSCLTTEENKVAAHKDHGWEIFTENTIKYISENHPCKLVFMLWGAQARKVEAQIDQERHLILKADHPAVVRHNPKLWFNNRNFSKANKFINKHYEFQRKPIDWHTIPAKVSLDDNTEIMDRCRQMRRAIAHHGIDDTTFDVFPCYDHVKFNMQEFFLFKVLFYENIVISEELKSIIKSRGFSYEIKVVENKSPEEIRKTYESLIINNQTI